MQLKKKQKDRVEQSIPFVRLELQKKKSSSSAKGKKEFHAPGAPNLTQEDLDKVDQYFYDHAQEYLDALDDLVINPKTGTPIFESIEEYWEYFQNHQRAK